MLGLVDGEYRRTPTLVVAEGTLLVAFQGSVGLCQCGKRAEEYRNAGTDQKKPNQFAHLFPSHTESGWSKDSSQSLRSSTNSLAAWVSLDLPDVTPQSNQHDRNSNQAHAESDTTLIALNHRGLPGLQIAGGDLQADLNIRIH